MPILTARGVRFMDFLHYPDIDIPKNKATFLTGNSGSGKSTLLKMLNAMETPSAGTIAYAGQDIAALNAVELRREVLLVSQETYLFEGSIAHNFKTFYGYRGLPAPGEGEMRRFLQLCGANFETATPADTMSGGERQRVYIAIYLSFTPPVLMLDEPTSALDEGHAALLMQNLKAHCAKVGTTLVIISHDAALATRFADHTVHLVRQGKPQAQGGQSHG